MKEKMQRVMVVDDARDAAESLALLFETLGFETCTAYDGQEAVDAVQTFRPDVIVLDIEMPVLDGFAAARAIRKLPDPSRPVLIALTALAAADVEQRTLAAGFDFYLSKPADLDRLISLMGKAIK